MLSQLDKAKNIPPYLSYISFQSFLDSLAQGVPTRIDHSVMKTMSGSQQSQMKQVLRYLNLTDNYGNATADLEALVESTDSQRRQLLDRIVRTAYDFLFTDSFTLTRATAAQLEEKFRQAGASGDTVRKCVTFFVNIAKDAGIELSTFILSQATPRPVQSKSRSQRPKTTSARAKGSSRTTSGSTATNASIPPLAGVSSAEAIWAQQLLEKFPSFDPAWPDEVKAQWFEGFRHLMQMGRSHRQPETSDTDDAPEDDDAAMAA